MSSTHSDRATSSSDRTVDLRRSEIATNTRTTKIDRYGWSVLDRPGVFMSIPKGDLLINHTDYQREQSMQKELRLASDWCWAACGALIVSLRDDRFWLVDGAHRKLAADRRADILELPCMVFECRDVAEEARLFDRCNNDRKPMSAIERLKPRVTYRDEFALEVLELATLAGRRISRYSDPTTLTCVAEIQKCLRADRKTLVRLWPLLTEITHGQTLNKELVAGVFYCERALVSGQSLTEQPWRNRIRKAGADGLLDAMRKARALHGKSGDRILALGILAAINKSARSDLARFDNKETAA
jgi:hypothetical protein